MGLINFLLIGIISLASSSLAINFVDFDTSMGAFDKRYRSLHKNLLKNLDNPKSKWFKHTSPQYNQYAAYSLVKATYNGYKNKNIEGTSERIPHIFHQIWVGKNPFPEKYKRWQKTWQNVPGWTYKLWTDKDVEEFGLVNKDAYVREQNLAARADIVRLEILYRIGGVYIDTDFECIRPEMFSKLNNSFDFYCGLHPLDCKQFLINNALIGSIPGHPILKACIDYLPFQANEIKKHTRQIMRRGPGLLTAMTLRHMNIVYKDIVFPPTYFYPLGVCQLKKKPYSLLLPYIEASLEEIKKDVIKPETIALHWWDGNWESPSAIVKKYQFHERKKNEALY